jgi:hypothetical protein
MKSYYRVILGAKIIPIAIILVLMLFSPSYSFGQRDSVFIHLNIASNSLFLIDKTPYECGDMDGGYAWKCQEALKERLNWEFRENFYEVEKSLWSVTNNLKNMNCPLAKQKVDDASKNVFLAKEKFKLVVTHIDALHENPHWVWWQRDPHERGISMNFFEGLTLLELLKKDLNYAFDELNKCD